MAGEGVDPSGLSTERIEAFLAARRAAGYRRLLTAWALEPLLGNLRELGAAPAPTPVAAGPVQELLERYGGYLCAERGLAPTTARCYTVAVRPFLAARAGAEGLRLDRISAADISGFIVAECRRRPRGSAKLVVTALRSLLGYLHVEGLVAAPLTGAVPAVAGWRLAGLPQGLGPDQQARLVAGCDPSQPAGRRDLAILLLLVRLGLRAGEIAGLGLDDVDWRAGEIVIHGKGSRCERLPLPADVGEALAAYLHRGRPRSAQGRVIFVRLKAPHRGLSSPAVTRIVRRAGERVGLGGLSAHRLRHTAATAMLRAGAPLGEIGQVLRHRRALTTAIYAKVDRDALATLARPWPGGAS